MVNIKITIFVNNRDKQNSETLELSKESKYEPVPQEAAMLQANQMKSLKEDHFYRK